MDRTYIGVRIFFILMFLFILAMEFLLPGSLYDPMEFTMDNIFYLLAPAWVLTQNQPSLGKVETDKQWKIRVDQLFLILFFLIYLLYVVRMAAAII